MKHALLASLLLATTSIASVASVASVAHAERAVVFPCAGDASDATRKTTEAALTQALRDQGFDIVAASQLEKLAPEERCNVAGCAEELLTKIQADIAVAAAVWNQTRTDHENAMASVIVIDGKGARYPAEALIEATRFDTASVSALRAALSLRLLGPGPWVSISTDPEHAKLRIDGQDVGSSPHRRAIDVGTHELEAKLDGYRVFKKTFDIPLKSERVFEVDATLVEDDGSVSSAEEADAAATIAVRPQAALGADDASALDSQPSTLPSYLVGGALIATGVALAITPLRTLAQDGECDGRKDPQGRCAARVEFGGVSAVLLGAAIVGVLGGTALCIWTPLEIDLGADHATAALRFQL